MRYAETDQMGVVHHSNYLIWFEAARSEFCRQHGINYSQMEMDGLLLPLIECRCRYISPAFYEDEVTIKMWVIDLKRSLLRIGYQALRSGSLLATGETTQLLVGKADKRPKTFPPDIAERFMGRSKDLRMDKSDTLADTQARRGDQ